DIYSSNIFYEYLEDYLFNLKIYEKTKLENIFKKAKHLGKAVKIFPVFPYFSLYAIAGHKEADTEDVSDIQSQTQSHSEKINCIILQVDKLKKTEIKDVEFKNKFSYMKSQYDNIILLEK